MLSRAILYEPSHRVALRCWCLAWTSAMRIGSASNPALRATASFLRTYYFKRVQQDRSPVHVRGQVLQHYPDFSCPFFSSSLLSTWRRSWNLFGGSGFGEVPTFAGEASYQPISWAHGEWPWPPTSYVGHHGQAPRISHHDMCWFLGLRDPQLGGKRGVERTSSSAYLLYKTA